MLRELYTLAERYETKKLYIWEVNRNSMGLFTFLAHKRVDISGFVTARSQFYGTKIMNRPVCGISDVEQQADTVLIIADECIISEVQNYFAKGAKTELISYSDCLTIDYRLRNNKVILYGMGEGSVRLQKTLSEADVTIYGYALTDITDQDQSSTDKPIYSTDELAGIKEAAVIIAVMPHSKYKWEILDNLEKKGVRNIYLNDTLVSRSDVHNSITFQLIDLAYKSKKKIYIYGQTNEYGRMIENILKIYDIPCEGYANENSLYDMYYEGYTDKFFVVNAIQRADNEIKCDQLERIGISLNDLAYTGLGYVNEKTTHYQYIPDCLVGHSTLYGDFNGINVHGNTEAKNRIIILGGSTSTTRWFRVKSWVEFLFERLYRELKGDIVLYNFAAPSNDVTVELLKLLRDGYFVRPNYVISLSGVNNLKYKDFLVNQFNVEESVKWLKRLDTECRFNAGIELKEDLFVFWVRIQKIIKAVCEIYGAKYLGILQPMNIGKEKKDLFETMMFEEEREKNNVASFYNDASDNDFYLNWMRMFENEEHMYVDAVHYSEKANRIIAEKIGDYVIAELRG